METPERAVRGKNAPAAPMGRYRSVIAQKNVRISKKSRSSRGDDVSVTDHSRVHRIIWLPSEAEYMKTTRLLAISLLTAAVTACGSSDLVAPARTTCATSALTGSYGTQRNGQPAPGTFWSSVGIATFDGRGSVNEQQSVSINGTASDMPSQTSGYVINADCTGTQSDASGKVVATLVMVHDGDELLGISVVPGSSMTVHYERIIGPCSNASLTGDYGFQRNGQTGPGASLVALGTITFDGKGNQFVQQTINRSGTITTVANLVGTYDINPDCTGTQTDPGTGKIISHIVIVHGGDEVLGISTTTGNNIVIHYERIK